MKYIFIFCEYYLLRWKSHPLQRNGLLRFQPFQEIEEVGFVRMSLQIRSPSQSAWASKSIQRNVPFTQVLPKKLF